MLKNEIELVEQKRLKLFKCFVIFMLCGTFIVIPMTDNYTIFSPKVFTIWGFLGVLASRLGVTTGYCIWGFLPVILYRIYLLFPKTEYSYKKDLNFFTLGMVLVLLVVGNVIQNHIKQI